MTKIEKRTLEEGKYIAETGDTVRGTALIFGVSKSTVHKDVAFRLYYLNKKLYKTVQKVLKFNLEDRHNRGGLATKKMYEKRRLKV